MQNLKIKKQNRLADAVVVSRVSILNIGEQKKYPSNFLHYSLFAVQITI